MRGKRWWGVKSEHDDTGIRAGACRLYTSPPFAPVCVQQGVSAHLFLSVTPEPFDKTLRTKLAEKYLGPPTIQ
jgi:hypothetical protein